MNNRYSHAIISCTADSVQNAYGSPFTGNSPTHRPNADKGPLAGQSCMQYWL